MKVYDVCKVKGLCRGKHHGVQTCLKDYSVGRFVEITEIYLPTCTVGRESLDDHPL